MFRPIGPLPPSVYWRRRVAVVAALCAAALIGLTVYAFRGGDNKPVANTSSPSGSNSQSSSGAATGGSSSAASNPASPSGTPASTPASSGATSTTPAAILGCTAAQLTITATTGAAAYKVGDQPVLTLQVTNKGPANCTQDLADSQVELRVYNGAARVWGSHDCEVQPGVNVMTLAVDKPVGVQIVWSGLSSQPACAGTRQRVGAGTYTLYPVLSGTQGASVQFSIS